MAIRRQPKRSVLTGTRQSAGSRPHAGVRADGSESPVTTEPHRSSRPPARAHTRGSPCSDVLASSRFPARTDTRTGRRRRRCAVLRASAVLLIASWAAISVCGFASPAGAQYFGQNKVPLHDREWRVLQSEHFDLHFYPEEREAAFEALQLAERAYARLSRILGHEFEERIPLLLYASPTEFRETRATAGLIGEGTGGLTEFMKRRVVVPFTGSYAALDHVLTHELVHAFQIDILSRGMLGGTMSQVSWTPPLWVIEGMAEYLSTPGLDVNTDMWMRDAVVSGTLISLEQLNRVGDIRVYRFGQSVLAHVGEHFGDEAIGQWFRSMARRRSLERGTEESIGLTLERLSEEWVDAQRRRYMPDMLALERPQDTGRRLSDHEESLASLYIAPAVSPDGGEVVYISNQTLYTDLYLASALDGSRTERLIRGQRSESFETFRFVDAAFDWAPGGDRIALVTKIDGREQLVVFDVRTKEVVRGLEFDLDEMLYPAFSPDGEELVFTGLVEAHSNLYVTRLDGAGLRALTDDRWAAFQPAWSPDGRRIAYVTDRDYCSAGCGPGRSPWKIALLDLETGRVEVLPGQMGKSINPQWFPDGRHLLYISDRTGVSNLFVRDLETHTDYQVTDMVSGVSGITATSAAMSLSDDGHRVVFSVYQQNGWNLYAIREPLGLIDEREPWVPPDPPEVEGPPPIAAVDCAPPGGCLTAPPPDGAAATDRTAAQGAVPGEASQWDGGPQDRRLQDGGPQDEGLQDGRPRDGGPQDRRPRDEDTTQRSPASDLLAAVEAPAVDSTRALSPAPGATERDGIPSSPSASHDDSLGSALIASHDDSPGSALIASNDDSSGSASIAGDDSSGSASIAGDDSSDSASIAGDDSSDSADTFGVSTSPERGVEDEESDVTVIPGPRQPPPEIDLAEVYAETSAYPESLDYEERPYRPRLSVDFASAGGLYATGYGLQAQSAILFSDMLGDRNLIVAADVNGSLEDGNYLIGYANLGTRPAFGVQLYQYWTGYGYSILPGYVEDYERRFLRGIGFSWIRPSSRFRRMELSLDLVQEKRYSYRYVGSSYWNPLDYVWEEKISEDYYARPEVAWVFDSAVWGPTGPLSGRRTRVSAYANLGQRNAHGAAFDHRRYFNLRQRYAFVVRTVLAGEWGPDRRPIAFGGPYSLRGYTDRPLAGQQIGFVNLEFRFPFIEGLYIAFPGPLLFGGIRGAFFFDIGAAWDTAREFRAVHCVDGSCTFDDLKAACGFRASMNLGLAILRWDLVRRSDLTRWDGKAFGELSIGWEF